MREIVIVISDLYLTEGREGAGPDAPTAPGLAHAMRFGHRATLQYGWRSWLAHWLGRPDLGSIAPATAAAAAAGGVRPDSAATVWIATPLHLAAGLTTLHADFRSRVRPARRELERLARDFHVAFASPGFGLQLLDSSEFLLFMPPVPPAQTTEPARLVVLDVADALPAGPGAVTLRRLGAEIDMWLHQDAADHPAARRGEPIANTLWLWGGGPTVPDASQAPGMPAAIAGPQFRATAFANDAFVQGLCKLSGNECQPLPQQLEDVFARPEVRRAIVVAEVGQALRSDERWTVPQALAELDRRFVATAIRGLRSRDIATMTIVANDRRLIVNARDHLKLWRRPRPGLEGLR